ncbi:MAG: signal peptidase I [Reinekea sp.]|nr:signal peptidase I [Reinekea sp.]
MNVLLKFFLAALGLVIPGCGFLITKQPWRALMVPILGLFWVWFCAKTRFVITEPGFYAMLGGLVCLYVIAISVSFHALFREQHKVALLQVSGLFILTLVLNLGITFASHQYKATWYGFAFYRIPSESMHPTLKIGDVVLVDTWVYKNGSPKTGDIVVFKRTANGMVLIKRVTQIRPNELYVEGDNSDRSVDSRRFGWVPTDYLVGKQQFVWFNLENLIRKRHEP